MTYPQPPAPDASPSGTVCAVIVSHQQNNEIINILELLTDEVSQAVLVTNGPDAPPAGLAGMFGEFLTLLTCPENNLAMAQNMGLREALCRGHGWALLLDDDSRPEPGMVAAMLAAWQAMPEARRQTTGLLAPVIRDEAMDRPDSFAKLWGRLVFYKVGFESPQNTLRNLLYVPASGSLIPAAVFAKAGYMEESFNIYFVDTEFCLRLRKLEYDIIAVRDARMRHRMGRRTTHRLLGLPFTTTNHSPRARYFMFRNRLKLWRRYGLAFPGYVLFDIARAEYEIFRVLCFEENKKQKLSAMLRGIRDALTGNKNPAM